MGRERRTRVAVLAIFLLAAGNRVVLISGGEEAFRQLLRVIDGAERTIHVTTYILGNDEVGEEVVARLARRAAEPLVERPHVDGCQSFSEQGLARTPPRRGSSSSSPAPRGRRCTSASRPRVPTPIRMATP